MTDVRWPLSLAYVWAKQQAGLQSGLVRRGGGCRKTMGRKGYRGDSERHSRERGGARGVGGGGGGGGVKRKHPFWKGQLLATQLLLVCWCFPPERLPRGHPGPFAARSAPAVRRRLLAVCIAGSHFLSPRRTARRSAAEQPVAGGETQCIPTG